MLDQLTALRQIATIESIGSSTRIEEPKLSAKDVKKVLAGLVFKEFASKDKQDVANYAQTVETIVAHLQDILLNANHNKQLHRNLRKNFQ